jgi:hypothetical protein
MIYEPNAILRVTKAKKIIKFNKTFMFSLFLIIFLIKFFFLNLDLIFLYIQPILSQRNLFTKYKYIFDYLRKLIKTLNNLKKLNVLTFSMKFNK